MTSDHVRSVVKRLGIPGDAISVGGPGDGECYVLQRDGAEWVVYYAERGFRQGEQRFASEPAACRYLIGWLIDDVLGWR